MRQKIYQEILNTRTYRAKLTKITGWMELLTEDEVFVLKRHIIDGIDWPRISVEYGERWGDEYTKSDRQMQRILSNALDKIAFFQSDGVTQ